MIKSKKIIFSINPKIPLALLTIYCVLFINTTSWSQENDTSYIYPIFQSDDNYQGLGFDWIIDNSTDKQFILFGEQHGVKEIPQFVTYVYESLYENGFHYMVLEMDYWTSNNIINQGVEDVIAKYPHSIAFDYNGDIHLIESVANKFDKAGKPIWGVDQMVTAIHPYQYLAEIATTPNAKRLARGAYLKASLKMGEYLRQDHFKDLKILSEVFETNPQKELSNTLKNLQVSMEIYTNYRAAKRGSIPFKVSSSIRENYMKKQLDFFVHNESKDQNLPKAIFKMGGAHTMNGIGPNKIFTLGNHAKEIAQQNRLSTLSVGIRNFNPKNNNTLLTNDDFNDSKIILLDTKNLLKMIGENSVKVSKDFLFNLNGYDAIIYIKDSSRANNRIVYKSEEKFKSNLIKNMTMGILLLLFCLSSIVPVVRNLLKKSKSKEQLEKTKHKLPIVLIFFVSVIVLIIILIQIIWIIDFPNHNASIISGTKSLWLYLLFFIISAYFALTAIISIWKKWWTFTFRIYYLFLAICFFLLSYFIYYWNLGGMLG